MQLKQLVVLKFCLLCLFARVAAFSFYSRPEWHSRVRFLRRSNSLRVLKSRCSSLGPRQQAPDTVEAPPANDGVLPVVATTTTSANVSVDSTASPSPSAKCFPLSATLAAGQLPNMTRSQWWCDSSLEYGFLGFSYPLEVSDCSDKSNSLKQISADFADMKKTYGATHVRIYAPECRDQTIWQTLIAAAVANNMYVG